MSRAELIAVAAGVASGLALAIVALWFFVLRAGNGGVWAEPILLQELADRWTVSLREHAEHWAAVYPLTWRA